VDQGQRLAYVKDESAHDPAAEIEERKKVKPDVVVDCTGLFCPEPIFRTRIALDNMDKGQVLEVTADDPAAEEDLKRLASRLGHTVLEVKRDGDEVTLLIRK